MALTGSTPAGASHQLQTMQLAEVGKLFIGGQYFILLLHLLSSLNCFFVIFSFYFIFIAL